MFLRILLLKRKGDFSPFSFPPMPISPTGSVKTQFDASSEFNPLEDRVKENTMRFENFRADGLQFYSVLDLMYILNSTARIYD